MIATVKATQLRKASDEVQLVDVARRCCTPMRECRQKCLVQSDAAARLRVYFIPLQLSILHQSYRRVFGKEIDWL